MGHEYQDRVSLELARAIAAGLPAHPEWIAMARENLDRWERSQPRSASSLRNYEEWRRVLDLPLIDVAQVLVAETEHGQRVRQSSPFPGALTTQKINEIRKRCKDDSIAA